MTIDASLLNNSPTSRGVLLLLFPVGWPLPSSGALPEHLTLVLSLHGGPGAVSMVTSPAAGAPGTKQKPGLLFCSDSFSCPKGNGSGSLISVQNRLGQQCQVLDGVF